MKKNEKMTPHGLFVGFGMVDAEPQKPVRKQAEKPLESEAKPAPAKRPGRPKKSQ